MGKTSIPIPKILDWSDDASNTIGSEYIIMEHAPGVCLASKWHEMTEVQRTLCMKPIYQKMKEAANLAFPAYGSIYRTDTPYIEGSTIPLDSNFCIGPSCEDLYWDIKPTSPKYYHEVKPNRGPWPSLSTFTSALTDVGLSRLPPAIIASTLRLPSYHGTISEHKVLLEYCRAITKQMIQTTLMQTVSTPILFHPDLHSRNIFVSDEDPTVLTAILDWQASAIQPAFWYADSTPDFAQKEVVEVAAEDDEQGGAGDRGQGQEREQKQPTHTPASTLRAEAFTHLIQSHLPRAMLIPRTMDEAYLRPFTYGHRSWLHGATPFREELIQTSRRWGELGFSTVGPCAYPMPSREEYAAHWEKYKEFEARHTFKLEVQKVLGVESGGWVWADMYDVTNKAQKEWFEEAMKGAVGERGERVWVSEDGERLTEAEIRDTWPFDLED
ncbi:hypothetical protein J4E83_008951 [Alternaria metachromatica]|uniref:uncharacterized protein n=1 Tax=Alternaria metachromatica TaxID=283354 RepID=UPI0020C22B99|nr:uncharacterized protein J4E83_008951 [Alternaria metachromatica]KAI4608912.1 hypothetical protein J4E83_008951 [Alternaria metachromatica]